MLRTRIDLKHSLGSPINYQITFSIYCVISPLSLFHTTPPRVQMVYLIHHSNKAFIKSQPKENDNSTDRKEAKPKLYKCWTLMENIFLSYKCTHREENPLWWEWVFGVKSTLTLCEIAVKGYVVIPSS